MNAKLGFALILAIALVVVRSADGDNTPRVPKGGDRFIGTYLKVPADRVEGARRFTITKEGEHYRLHEVALGTGKKCYFEQYKFVQKLDGQLADEKDILGTLTLGSISFENGTTVPSSVVLLCFCYEQFYLIKERPPLQVR